MADATRFLQLLKDLQMVLEQHSHASTNLVDQHGYNGLPLSAGDMARTTAALHKKFEAVDWERRSTAEVQSRLDEASSSIERVVSQLVPNLLSTVHPPAHLLLALYSIDAVISSELGVEDLTETLRLPSAVQREVLTVQRRLQASTANVEGIDKKIQTIKEAYEAADRLPATLLDLDQALKDVQTIRSQALSHEGAAKKSADDAEQLKGAIDGAKAQADDVLSRVHQAFRAATSQGLAREFKAKADALERSMYGWAVVLLLSLGAAICIGAQRFPVIVAAAEKVVPGSAGGWSVLTIQLVVGALGLAGPVWMAWIATKQIGQRFRLSEDYAYKAALSSAYEGYRNEAASLDPMLQAQLFAIALTRLDEIPLRLVEQDVPGSPLHEILKSPEFKAAAAAIPTFRDKVLEVLSVYPKTWFGGQPATKTGGKGDDPPATE